MPRPRRCQRLVVTQRLLPDGQTVRPRTDAVYEKPQSAVGTGKNHADGLARRLPGLRPQASVSPGVKF